MHNAAPIPEPTPSSDANYPTTEHASYAAVSSYPDCQSEGQTSPTSSSADDLRRELSIQQRGRDIQRHRELSRAASDLGVMWEEMALMNVAKREMYTLIAQRSPEQIARMQAAQAERMALEPGAEKDPQ